MSDVAAQVTGNVGSLLPNVALWILTPLRKLPNVAKRSIWYQWKYWRPIDRRPTSDLENFEWRYTFPAGPQRVIRSTVWF